jgi:hypothetical protein
MTLSTLSSLRFAAAAVALLAFAAAFPACSDSPSPAPAMEQPASSPAAAASSNSPEDVARRAVQAGIDGDEEALLEEVRPDERAYWVWYGSDDVRDSSLDRAQILVEDSLGVTYATVLFADSCGAVSCKLILDRLSGRCYVHTLACT